MSWETDLDAYLNKKEIKSSVKQYIATSGGTGGVASSSSDVIRYAELARNAIIDSLPNALKVSKTHAITTQDLIIGDVIINAAGDFEVSMRWNQAAVIRESLCQTRYNGIDDIVKLFATGYSTNGKHVYGAWKAYDPNRIIKSLAFRSANPFLQNAIAAFNAAHAGENVKITLDPSYLTR